MNLLNTFIIKNLKLNKKRTIVTIIGIILSVALICALTSLYVSAVSSFAKYETDIRGDFHYAFFDVDVKDLDLFDDNIKINSYYVMQNIGYTTLETSNEYKPYALIKALSDEALASSSIHLLEGRFPKNANEIVIPSHLKTNGHVDYQVGDEITLKVGERVNLDGTILNQTMDYQQDAEKIINTKTYTYKIVGIIERPAPSIEPYSAPGYTFITYIPKDRMTGLVDVYAKYTKAGIKRHYEVTAGILGIDAKTYSLIDQPSMSKEEVEDYNKAMSKARYQTENNSYLITLETNPLKDGALGGLGSVCIIVAIIIVFTSVFCIKNSLDISTTEKIKQYGMLRSVGATKKQIRHNVFYETTILGLIGIPLGILCGLLAAFILIIVSNYFLSSGIASLKLQFAFSFVSIIISIVIGMLTLYLSSIRSARAASKVSPIVSIRNSADIKIKAKKLKTPKVITKLFGIGGDISYKNFKRNKKKYRTTIISIAVSVTIFISLTYFMSLAFASFDNELVTYDYNLSLTLPLNDNVTYETATSLTDFTEIKDYAIRRRYTVDIANPNFNPDYLKVMDDDGASIIILALGDHQYRKYVKELGLDDGAIILNDIIKFNLSRDGKEEQYRMRLLNYQASDEISLSFEDDIVKLKVTGVTDQKPFAMLNDTSNQPYLIVSDKMFDKLIKENTKQDLKDLDLTIYYDATDANALEKKIDDALKGEDYNINNIAATAKIMQNIYILIGIFLYGFIIVISLIGITNIFNAITTNMYLRRQEFAMLKSIGMTNAEFKKMIRLESIFMCLKALFIGITLGIILTIIMYKTLDFENVISYTPPIMAIIIAIIIVYLLINILMRYSLKKINKENTIETIRNENI